MWEDDLTGAIKFRARWLVRSSDLSKEALSRLPTSRRRSAGDGSDGEQKPDLKGNSSPDQSRETDDDDDDDDVIFLTAKEEDLDADAIVKPVAISLAASATIDTPRKPKQKTGPRLTHAFDASSGDFTPVKDTHAIITRARARQAEGLASASNVSEESAAGKGGKPAAQGRPWFLPKRQERLAAGRSRDVVATPVRGTREEKASSSSNGNPSVATESEGRGVEKDEDQVGDDNDHRKESSGGSDAAAASAPPASAVNGSDEVFTPRKSGRLKKLQQSPDGREAVGVPWHGRSPGVSEIERQGPPRPARSRRLVMPAAGPPRTRRLAMPPADTAGATAKCTGGGGGAAPHPAGVRGSPGSVRTPRSSAGAAGAPPSLIGSSAAPTAKLMSGKRKRTPTAKRMEGVNESCEVEAPDFIPPRRTLVGEGHQVDIPDLLPAEDRSKAAATGRAEGAGAKMVSGSAWPSRWFPRVSVELPPGNEGLRPLSNVLPIYIQ